MASLAQEESRQMLWVVGTAAFAGVSHLGRLMYENKPVPLKQAIGGSVLTLCVGGAGGALTVSYWHLPGPVVATGALVLGFIGGPVILATLAKIGQKALEKRAEAAAGGSGEGGI